MFMSLSAIMSLPFIVALSPAFRSLFVSFADWMLILPWAVILTSPVPAILICSLILCLLI